MPISVSCSGPTHRGRCVRSYVVHYITRAFYASCPAIVDATVTRGLPGGARRIERRWTEPLVGDRAPSPMDFLSSVSTRCVVSTSLPPLPQALFPLRQPPAAARRPRRGRPRRRFFY